MSANYIDDQLIKRQKYTPVFFDTYRFSWPIGIVLTGCLLITVLIRFRLIFLVSSDIGGIESNVIYAIQRYMAGYSLYTNPELAPYSITQYSPLYYRIVAAVTYWAGIGPDELLPIYQVSRSVSLVANLLYAVALYGISYRLYPNKKAGLMVAVVAFVLLPPQAYSRPDSIYNMLVLGALYANLRSLQSRQRVQEYSWLAGSIGLSALAIATKQSGIVLLLLMAGYYAFFCRQWWKAIGVSLTTGLLAIGFLLCLMPEHDPLLLYANIINGVNQGVDFSSFKVNIIDHYLRTYSFYNAIGLPLCVWLMQQAKPNYRWLGWCVMGLFVFSLVTSLKWGSALNYFTEYVALTGIVVVLWVSQWPIFPYVRTISWTLLLSGIVWAVVPNIPNFNWSMVVRPDALSKASYYQQKQIASYLVDSLHLRATDAVFITDYNYCYLNSILFRNCIVPQQDMVGPVMYPQRKFNYHNFDRQINQHGIRFLITRTHEKATLFPGLSTDHFHFKRTIGSYSIYEDSLSTNNYIN